MKFDELDKKLRIYETAHDYCIPPEIYIVARLDGRSFTNLTKKKCQFNVPFDERFRDYMIETVKHLMNCGFNIIYGYTESDEISLLFDYDVTTFSRKKRKYISILAGEASGKFSHLIGTNASFDCRLCKLPNKQLVVDYFRWRNEDANRNALNSYCYWELRKNGYSGQKASSRLKNLGIADKNDLLFSNGINYNNLPEWQKKGIGLYWTWHEKKGYNPKSGQPEMTFRRQITTNLKLPKKDEYDNFLFTLIEDNGNHKNQK
jgi:tRNA(His) guanylyltransferase